ncbi:FAD-binding domain-containing protein [Aspergillus sclerotiicarbonarius CBS 121057]|uniref:FAD-binding domain-containing protein n=1 Tax=Aspergillus sclerotiicarbonarius (strain CBS 121057 / IBT 28362) TaxID=1448318 RepID=A0A319EPR0_ASPSB|nr:FAD-binding domain-containing protein [Aspergillus sclerotiicarbonarius CBS 121057]
MAWLLWNQAVLTFHQLGVARVIWEPRPLGKSGFRVGPQLSNGAQIILPNNTGFVQATQRWSLFDPPNFTAVIEMGTEEDVKFANRNNISFLAVTGTHGTITRLGKFNGIEIMMRKLNSTVISKHPALGGCHGILQGKYGIVSDQFVSMRMVTADRAICEVSSSGPNSDLWWAMQGAGHNFGIVTSINSKVYDMPDGGSWSYETYVFSHDKVGTSVSTMFPKFTEPFRKLTCNVAGTSQIRFPIGRVSYNANAQRALMDTFAQIIGPDSPFNVSQALFEGYPMYGVNAVPDNATAFPHRRDNQLVTVAMVNIPNPELDAQAVQIGKRLRQSLQNLYGFEPWRLKRPKELKTKYDPQGRLGYYTPILCESC